MSLRRRRAEVAARTGELEALRARAQARTEVLNQQLRARWPWLWVGGGALLGVAVERHLDRRPRRPFGGWLTGLAALPWGVLLPVFERVLMADLLERDQAAAAAPHGRANEPQHP